MLDINLIRQEPEAVKNNIAKKSVDPKLVDRFLYFDEQWRAKNTAHDQLKAEQNTLSKELAKNKTDHSISRDQLLKKRISEIETERNDFKKRRDEKLASLPNLLADDFAPGPSEKENQIIREVGKKPQFKLEPKN